MVDLARAAVTTPVKMRQLRAHAGGSEWIDSLPRLVDECAELWSLRVGMPYDYAYVSLAHRVELMDGTPAVLKISFPHRESEHEPHALAHYDGAGAVRLLAYDPERRAMLLERAEPGTPLLAVEDEHEAYAIAAGVLGRLWKPVGREDPFRSLAEDAARWAVSLPERWERLGRPFERELIEATVAAFVELPPTQGELVVCHQDFHRENVLRAQREPWLAIDPKPVVAEREFDIAALLRDGPGDVAWRLDFLASELGLDRDRARRWALAHTTAWAFDESDPHDEQLDVARHLLRL